MRLDHIRSKVLTSRKFFKLLAVLAAPFCYTDVNYLILLIFSAVKKLLTCKFKQTNQSYQRSNINQSFKWCTFWRQVTKTSKVNE